MSHVCVYYRIKLKTLNQTKANDKNAFLIEDIFKYKKLFQHINLDFNNLKKNRWKTRLEETKSQNVLLSIYDVHIYDCLSTTRRRDAADVSICQDRRKPVIKQAA